SLYLCSRLPSTLLRHSFPTRRSSDLSADDAVRKAEEGMRNRQALYSPPRRGGEYTRPKIFLKEILICLAFIVGSERAWGQKKPRSEEHTSELQSLAYLVCRLLLEKKK